MATQSAWQRGGGNASLRDFRHGSWSPRQQGADGTVDSLAHGLGWFSIGLGLAELVASRRLGQLIGVRDDRGMLPVLGLREIATGIGILAQPRQAGWLWMRVAGDIMDLSLLATAMTARRNQPDRIMAAAAAVVGVTMLDIFCSRQLSRRPRQAPAAVPRERAVRTTKTIMVGRPREEIYRYWRDFENLPHFMSHLESVKATGDNRSHWKAALGGTTFEWDAEITEDRPNEWIAWRSLPGGDIRNEGSVEFARASGGRETRVKVTLRYDPPGGTLGLTLAKLLGQEPGQQVQEDLRRFKQLMETGEVATTEGQSSGRKGMLGRVSVARVLEGELR